MTKRFVRKLQRTGRYSYILGIPKELVTEFGWQEQQKIELIFRGRQPEVIIKDWQRK